MNKDKDFRSLFGCGNKIGYKKIFDHLMHGDAQIIFNNLSQAVIKFNTITGLIIQNHLFSSSFKLIYDINDHFNKKIHLFWSDYKNIETFNATYNKLFEELIHKYQDYYNKYGFDINTINLSDIGFVLDHELPKIEEDKRFEGSDLWNRNFYYNIVAHSYQIYTKSLNYCFNKATENNRIKDEISKKQLRFIFNQYLNSICPTNFIATNPLILHRIIQTKGYSLLSGADNMYKDILVNSTMPRITTSCGTCFTVGTDLAITKGKVVFRNEMFELIQYSPINTSINAIPLLIVTAWINKYYIMDLRPENSMVKWLLEQGYNVFIISWINPKIDNKNLNSRYSVQNIEFYDYLHNGLIKAIENVKSITKSEQINCIGYCLGGTLLAICLSYLKKKKNNSIKSATFLTSMVDFEDSGDIGVFIEDEILDIIDQKMKQDGGFLDGNLLFTTFSFLKSKDMIWMYYVHNYMLGTTPKSFDMLHWNADSTNLPQKMHSYYLRNLYQKNLLSKPNAIKVDNIEINLSDIEIPICSIAAEKDHIAPWIGIYKSMNLFGSKNKKFILSLSGHVAGVVNHPKEKKYGYITNDNLNLNNEEWLKNGVKNQHSWWPCWNQWMETNKFNGNKIKSQEIKDYGLGSAPGEYVHTLIS